jgi:hypothetical protein
MPQLPKDLTELSEQDVMKLFTEYTAWTNFLAAKASVAEIDEYEADANVRREEALALLGGGSIPKGQSAQARAHRATMATVQEAQAELAEKRAYRKLICVMRDNHERAMQLLSRELSRRLGISPQERRNIRWTP